MNYLIVAGSSIGRLAVIPECHIASVVVVETAAESCSEATAQRCADPLHGFP